MILVSVNRLYKLYLIT